MDEVTFGVKTSLPLLPAKGILVKEKINAHIIESEGNKSSMLFA